MEVLHFQDEVQKFRLCAPNLCPNYLEMLTKVGRRARPVAVSSLSRGSYPAKWGQEKRDRKTNF